jgi:predicted Zn-dependent peptidase
MEHLSEASLDDVAEFFRTYYTPDNAVLSIAGDFDPVEARALVEQHFGGIPRGNGRPPLRPMELPPTMGGAKREVVQDEVMLPRLFLAMRSPSFGTEEYYAASVCGAVLGMRKGSRLFQHLVRERQVAADAGAFTYDLARGADLLVADVTARPEVGADALEEAVHAELDRLHAEGVTEDEVARAVALIGTDLVTSMQQASERADQLSRFATFFGDPSLVNVQLGRYEAVTAAQVTAFARARLGRENRAALLYVPKE